MAAKLQAAGFRVELICVTKKSVYKIRDNNHTVSLIKSSSAIKKQENKVAVRRKAEDLGSLNVDDFIAQLQQEITDALVNH